MSAQRTAERRIVALARRFPDGDVIVAACSDGSAWSLESRAARPGDPGHRPDQDWQPIYEYWHELPPIPGTPRDEQWAGDVTAEAQLAEDCTCGEYGGSTKTCAQHGYRVTGAEEVRP